jgi:hypothetical protein
MGAESRKAEYLEEAARAEENARKALLPEIRDSWLKIAELYRQMARDLRTSD